MESPRHGNPIADIDDGREPVAAAGDGLTKAGIALAGKAVGTGPAANVAALYRDDPPEVGGAVRDMVFGMARSVPANAFAASGDRKPSPEVEDRTYRKVGATPGRAMTVSVPASSGRATVPRAFHCSTVDRAFSMSETVNRFCHLP